MVGLKSSAAQQATRHADINIFTVASGLLYEVRHPYLNLQLKPLSALHRS